MKIQIPTLTEVYPQLVQDQIMKQQTSLLTAILDLHKTIQGFQLNNNDQQLVKENKELHEYVVNLEREVSRLKTVAPSELQLRVNDLTEQLNQCCAENKEFYEENTALNRELDLQEQRENETETLKRELEFQLERFKTLQEHYKNSVDFAKQMQDELKAAKAQAPTAPKGYKSWEEAAMTERLHHNQTKTELDNAKAEVATTKLKLERFQKLFREALGQ